MINETREAYPGCTLTVLVPENLSDIYLSNPAIDNIIKIPSKYVHGLIAVTKIKELISILEFDVGYILPPSFGSAASFKLAGIKERIGYITDGRRLLLSKPLVLPAPLNSMHRSEHYFNLLRRSTDIDIEYNKPKIFLNDDDNSKGLELLSHFDIKPNDNFIILAFQAVAESRRWGIENYTNLTKKITEVLGYKVVLTGIESDRTIGDSIVQNAGEKGIVNLAGKTSIRELGAIMSLAKLFIGNDSGPAHFAAAVGTPIIVLSGADDPKSTSPKAAAKKLIYKENLDCISCVKNKCPLKDDKLMLCMKQISVDEVYNSISELT
jgi:heptosyltransferase-2